MPHNYRVGKMVYWIFIFLFHGKVFRLLLALPQTKFNSFEFHTHSRWLTPHNSLVGVFFINIHLGIKYATNLHRLNIFRSLSSFTSLLHFVFTSKESSIIKFSHANQRDTLKFNCAEKLRGDNIWIILELIPYNYWTKWL